MCRHRGRLSNRPLALVVDVGYPDAIGARFSGTSAPAGPFAPVIPGVVSSAPDEDRGPTWSITVAVESPFRGWVTSEAKGENLLEAISGWTLASRSLFSP